MKIRTKIILAFLLVTIPIIIVGVVSLWGLNTINRQISTDLKQNMSNLENTIILNNYASLILYYDEVLTQSARNYAFTGDKKWQERYFENSLELDRNIKEAIDHGDEEDKKIFSLIDEANITLVKMEEESMRLVDKGEKEQAVKILEGTQYSMQKKIYIQGLNQYIEKKDEKFNEALSLSVSNLDISIQSLQNAFKTGISWTGVGVLFTVLFAIVMGIIVAGLISKPIRLLNKATKEISDGKLEQKVVVNSKDEIGELADNFNKMTDKVVLARENIENKVKERTAELEKTNKYMVGRELKMIELKKEILKLKQTKS